MLSEKELRRVEVIERLIRGEITNTQAARLLDLSVRQIKRIKKGVKEEGLSFLAHKNRGRKPKHAIPTELRERVVSLYTSKYLGANYSHTAELLAEYEDIYLSVSTVRRILKSAGIVSPRKHRQPKVYKSRHRMPKEGMLVQMDGSTHYWFESRGPRVCLQAAIDDATGKILAATFRPNEDLQGYFEILRQMLTNYGIPVSIYTDRHTIFKSPKSDKLSIEDQLNGIDEPLTQFGKAINKLGINNVFANSPQAKGLIERLWRTLQDRLVIELRLLGINTIESANKFLPTFLEKFNRSFAVAVLDPTPAYRPCQDIKALDLILCRKVERKVLNGSTFAYNGTMYRLLKDSTIIPLKPGKRVTIHILQEGELIGEYEGEYYKMEEFTRNRKEEVKEKEEKPKNKYVPGPDHPWRRWYPKK
ncbi:ISNCY family transposase [bacterium]|nr:ISNCY family transposase [bacterium]